MSEAERSFVTVMSRVLGPKGIAAYAELLRNPVEDPAGDAFAQLPADADEQTRAEVAEGLVAYVLELWRQNPGLSTLSADAPRGEKYAKRTVNSAFQEIYNEAQADVLCRLSVLLTEARRTPVSRPADPSEEHATFLISFSSSASPPPRRSPQSSAPSRASVSSAAASAGDEPLSICSAYSGSRPATPTETRNCPDCQQPVSIVALLATPEAARPAMPSRGPAIVPLRRTP